MSFCRQTTKPTADVKPVSAKLDIALMIVSADALSVPVDTNSFAEKKYWIFRIRYILWVSTNTSLSVDDILKIVVLNLFSETSKMFTLLAQIVATLKKKVRPVKQSVCLWLSGGYMVVIYFQ